MYERGKSDNSVVPAKPPNKAGGPAAEVVEGRGLAEGNTDSSTRPGRSAGPGVSSGLDRVREVARRDKEARFTALLHHVDLARLWAAYRAINPKAAPGVDGVTWDAYGQDLEANLRGPAPPGAQRGATGRALLGRVYIPKPDGRQRPLGIATLEDKIVQRAVVEVLNAIYEEDFLGFSYGFRPGRGPHDALDALAVGITERKVNWILDADVSDFFSKLDQAWLRGFSSIALRTSESCGSSGSGWLQESSRTATGRRRSRGHRREHRFRRCSPTCTSTTSSTGGLGSGGGGTPGATWSSRRFADDFVVGFQHLGDAQTVPRRSSRAVREVQPGAAPGQDSAHRVRPLRGRSDREERGLGKPETFDFLGFTHICGKTKDGRFWLRRVTIKKRMRAKLKQVKAELRRRRHLPIPEQGRWLASVVRGHLAYYAVPGNIDAVSAFRDEVRRLWHEALRRRSQRSRLTWERMSRIADSMAAPCPHRASPSRACASPPGPKAGAQCGSSARRDLSGGPPARAVPTGHGGGDGRALHRRGSDPR